MSNENLDVIIEHTRKFIDAAAPVAQQAYEIGLMTLRIDAAQIIVACVLALVLFGFVLRKIAIDYKAAKEEAKEGGFGYDPTNYLPMDGVPHTCLGVLSAVGSVIVSFKLLNLWLWVKLFAPELWLAHQAIEKIVR